MKQTKFLHYLVLILLLGLIAFAVFKLISCQKSPPIETRTSDPGKSTSPTEKPATISEYQRQIEAIMPTGNIHDLNIEQHNALHPIKTAWFKEDPVGMFRWALNLKHEHTRFLMQQRCQLKQGSRRDYFPELITLFEEQATAGKVIQFTNPFLSHVANFSADSLFRVCKIRTPSKKYPFRASLHYYPKDFDFADAIARMNAMENPGTIIGDFIHVWAQRDPEKAYESLRSGESSRHSSASYFFGGLAKKMSPQEITTFLLARRDDMISGKQPLASAVLDSASPDITKEFLTGLQTQENIDLERYLTEALLASKCWYRMHSRPFFLEAFSPEKRMEIARMVVKKNDSYKHGVLRAFTKLKHSKNDLEEIRKIKSKSKP